MYSIAARSGATLTALFLSVLLTLVSVGAAHAQDSTPPSIVALSGNPEEITDADAGEVFTIEIDFSENMDTSVVPVLSFPADDPSPTLSFESDAWEAGDTVYKVFYRITDADQVLSDIELQVSGAQDEAGNTMESETWNPFSINMGNGSVTVRKTVIGDDAVFNFNVTNIESGEVVDTFSISTSGGTGSTAALSVPAGVFAIVEEVSTGYELTDVVCTDPTNDSVVDLSLNGVAVVVSAGEAIDCTFTNVGGGPGDTTSPEAVAINLPTDLLLDPFAGQELTIEVQFSEQMNAAVAPAITFPNADPSPTLSFLDGVWSAGNTIYTATYEISDADQYLLDVEVRVEGAEDVAGNAMTPKSVIAFSIAMGQGGLNITKSVVGADGSFPFVLTYVATGEVVGEFSLDTSTGATFSETDIPVGQYTMTEGVTPGYALTDVVCTDPSNNSSVSVAQLGGTLDIGHNETVSCTFTNTQDPAPVPTINGPTGPISGAFDIAIKFSRAVTGFEVTDLVVSNGEATALTGSDTIYLATIEPLADGVITIGLPAGVGQSVDSQPSLASNTYTVTADLQAPVASLNAPTGNDGVSLPVEIVFSEPVTGFTAGDLVVTGGTLLTPATSTAFTLVIEPDINEAAVGIELPAGVVTDLAGNDNAAASFEIDTAPANLPPVLVLATTSLTPDGSALTILGDTATYSLSRDALIASIEDENPGTVNVILSCTGLAPLVFAPESKTFTLEGLPIVGLINCFAQAVDAEGVLSGRSVFEIDLSGIDDLPTAQLMPVTGLEGADTWVMTVEFDAEMDTESAPSFAFFSTLSVPSFESGSWSDARTYQATFGNGGDDFALRPGLSRVVISDARSTPATGALQMAPQDFLITQIDLAPSGAVCAGEPIALAASPQSPLPGERVVLYVLGDVEGCELSFTYDRDDTFFNMVPELFANRIVFETKATVAGPIEFIVSSTDDNGDQVSASAAVMVREFSALNAAVSFESPLTIRVSNDQQGFFLFPRLSFQDDDARLTFFETEAVLSVSDPSLVLSVNGTPMNGADQLAIDLGAAVRGIRILPNPTQSGVFTATFAVTLTDYSGQSITHEATVIVELFRGDPGIVPVPDGSTLDDGSDGVVDLLADGVNNLLDLISQRLANPGNEPADVTAQSPAWIDFSVATTAGVATTSKARGQASSARDTTPSGPSHSDLVTTQFSIGGGETVELTFDLSGAIEAALAQGLDGSITGEVDLFVDNPGATGRPDLTYRFTVQLPALEGNLTISTITRPAVAGDEVFRYVSDAPGFEDLSLQTQGNSSATESLTIRAGSYDITQITPEGWALDAISCTGDNDNGSSFDVEAGLARIDLDVGETLVCVFENVRDEETVQLATQRAIVNFMTQRARLLASNRPDLMGRARGNARAGYGQISGFGDDDRQTLRFAASLQSVRALHAQNERAKMSDIGEDHAFSDPGPAQWDVWIQASAARASFEGESAGQSKTESAFSAIYLGADFALSPSLKLGAIASYDYMSQDGVTGQADSEGAGWMIGPYLTGSYREGLYYFARAAWGQSNNDISPLGLYFDTFTTDRHLIEAGVTGDILMSQTGHAQWRLSPEFGVYYFEETQDAYTDALGYRIAENTVSLGEVTFGPSIAWRRRFEHAGVLQTNARILGVWAFEPADFMSETGQFLSSGEGVTARANAGLTWTSQRGTQISGQLNYDGIGDARYQSYGASVRVTVPLSR